MKLADILDYNENHFKACFRTKDLPKVIYDNVEGGNGHDTLMLMEMGKSWTFEALREHQPRTAKMLMSGGDFIQLWRESFAGPIMVLVLEVNGQLIQLERRNRGYNPSDLNTLRGAGSGDRSFSLPEKLRLSYYHRIDGMGIPDSPTIGPFARILPFPVGRPWQGIDGWLKGFGLSKMLPLVEEMIPGIKPDIKGRAYTKFMMFLNSYGSFERKTRREGDVFFVKNHIQDGVIYYIRDADVKNMMILADPVEAIDRYCEHCLLRNEGRFDFRPWAVPFSG